VVDARGAAVSARRRPGLRISVPPEAACMPTRVTCRVARRHRDGARRQPRLADGDGLATHVLELGPVGEQFSRCPRDSLYNTLSFSPPGCCTATRMAGYLFCCCFVFIYLFLIYLFIYLFISLFIFNDSCQTIWKSTRPIFATCGFLVNYPILQKVFKISHNTYVPVYAKLQNFIQCILYLTLIKLCHIKRDHTVNFYIKSPVKHENRDTLGWCRMGLSLALGISDVTRH